MTWFSKLADGVRMRVQRRGQRYFEDGAVDIVRIKDGSVEAAVVGSQEYDVTLKRQEDGVHVHCDCPYFTDFAVACKHIWAALLEIKEQGLLEVFQSVPARLVSGGHLSDDSDDADPRSRVRRTKPAWENDIASVKAGLRELEHEPWPAGKELIYLLDALASSEQKVLNLETAARERKKNGEWGQPRGVSLPLHKTLPLPDPSDRKILMLLGGARALERGYYYAFDSKASRYLVPHALAELVIPEICRTERCYMRTEAADLLQLRWDDAGPWEFWLELARDGSGPLQLRGSLRRGEERADLAAPLFLTPGGLVFFKDRAALLNDAGAFAWISMLRERRKLVIPDSGMDDLLSEILRLPNLPPLDLPSDLRFQEIKVMPRPIVKVRKGESWLPEVLFAELIFSYQGHSVPAREPGFGILQSEPRRLLLRDPVAEKAARDELMKLGARATRSMSVAHPGFELASRHLPRIVSQLVARGWQVEAEGKLYRQPGRLRLEVNSGIDWFELHGTAEFGEASASLPQLLAALQRGENTVLLGDGTFGLLPEEWLRKYGVLAGAGTVNGDHLQFRASQVGLLDALLSTQPESTCDAVFEQARRELHRFDGIEPRNPPPSFIGELRGYQREGVGWFGFLERFGFGGCLADDMGLGKTVQVLALLESRRLLRAASGNGRPSLVVVPRSLLFNWKQEAARFVPGLRILDHTGAERLRGCGHFNDYDTVFTTYGTLRRDAVHLKDFAFDYVILDESQAIKNRDTESSKAARLLNGSHRLALSGTPIENHVGELWSLFEFLNPGILGSASAFKALGSSTQNPDPEARTLLGRALRPFILRRTKDQVAKDLPPKTEQTLFCELDDAQRKLYDQLRQHYRTSLLGLVERDGMNKSRFHVLEALLRLRQAACHPGLIDRALAKGASAKLEVLLSRIAEVVDEGHKVLVFSQFTSFLAIVRDRLDQEGISYLYLDGQTRDRAAPVRRFQEGTDSQLFLISLKAGGLGLNLTAAEYVFLLDPWWNPAVEAQAIDRTHRIGQTRPVFAYRLIARDTVEEKVLQLQEAKKELVDAILGADNSLIRDLRREDLELLLS